MNSRVASKAVAERLRRARSTVPRALLAAAAAIALGAAAAKADEVASAASPGTPDPGAPAASGAPPVWLLGGQVTSAGFLVPGFHSPYRNPGTSFGGPEARAGWSFVTTLFAGARLWGGAIAVAQPEFSDGAGAPNVSGVAGYVDGNIIRVAKVGKAPYLARLFFQQDFALGAAEAAEPGTPEDPFMPASGSALGRGRPPARIELTAGKLAMTDFFDVATASSDPRHHFVNWSLMTNGAWDFAADTRGYTWGVVVALEQPRWAVRAGAAMMPTTPNGPVLDGDLVDARSEMVEGEVRFSLAGNAAAVKVLGYANHARMGTFSDALAAAPPGQPPSVDAVERRGAAKYGLALLVDQRLGPASAFLRASWNDGATEEYAFTQIERAVSAGVELPVRPWGGTGDRVGAGFAVNMLSSSHARYLEAGGTDFQLGDGALRYAPEAVVEAYYTLHAGAGVEVTADVQGIANPGMNADRGPAVALGLRVHAHR